MKNTLEEKIAAALAASSFAAGAKLKSVQESAGEVSALVEFAYPMLTQSQAFAKELGAALVGELDGARFSLDCVVKVDAHETKGSVANIPNVKNIIAIASGKGGVGKSTTAVNLALALVKEGAQVGLLDADIYGPSQPIMMGLADAQPETVDKKSIEPVENYGLQTMSIGYLVKEEQAMIWRGPMASGALQQLINDTRWRDLDYLIVDLPPGTGDIQLTLAQKVPVTAAVIVTTPQDVALADAKKAVAMFEKVSVPVLGLVENMSLHICSACGHEEAIFGHAGGEKLAATMDVEFLGALPLDKRICDDSDRGHPSVLDESAISEKYQQIARTMALKLAQFDKNYAAMLPTIDIVND